jgi:hypothetical protein
MASWERITDVWMDQSATVIEITTENYMFPLTSIRVQCVGEVIQI